MSTELERLLRRWPQGISFLEVDEADEADEAEDKADDATAVLENVYQRVRKIIRAAAQRGLADAEARNRSLGKKFELRGAHEIVQAMGFRLQGEGLDRLDMEYVLSSEVPLHDLRRSCDVLRHALKTRWDPPAPCGGRYSTRLAMLSHEQLVTLLATAATGDSATRASVDDAILSTCPSSVTWAELPDVAVSRIAVMLEGRRGLLWCTVCRNFRAAQPPVRALTIGVSHEVGLLPPAEEGDGLVIRFRNDGLLAHKIIESVAARHASELRRLSFVTLVHSPDEPLRRHPERRHGAHLTGLRQLEIVHASAGYSGPYPREGTNTLGRCAAELIGSVGGTLHELSVRATTKLRVHDLVPALPQLGPNLRKLHVDLIPFTPFRAFGSGKREDTEWLRAAARTHCPQLDAPVLVAHRDPQPH